MSKKLTLVLTLVVAVLPGAAYALGLGEIKLNSALNDKFSADIQIVGATSDELDSLDVKLASLAQFSQAGLDHPEALSQLQFVVVRNADGSAYVHITSNQGVREPFLDFLIDANWNNGELIREYTVLLNPQSFQTAAAPKPEAAQAPAAATVAAAMPAPAVAAPVPVSTPAPAQTQAETPAPAPEAAVAATEQPAAPAPQPTASPPPSPAPAAEPAPAQRALGANYGPIHRGETLSGIAKQVRPEGVTLNQMMIAIYQANPEVFTHNINRMKAGYILRMPSASDAQAVSTTDANAEVRAQMEAWRNNRGVAAAPAESTAASAQPALQLVAPSSAAEGSAPLPGADKQGNGEAAAGAAKPETAPEAAEAPVNPAPAPTPAAPPANQAPLTVKNNSLAAVQQQAAQQAAQPSPSVLPPPEAVKNEPLKSAAATAAKPAQAQESGGGFLDAILNIYVLGALVVVIVAVALGVMLKKRKKASPSGFNATGTARIKGADWMKQEQAGGENDNTASSSTTRTRTKAKKAAKQIEEMADEKTVLVNPPTEAAAGDDSDKTMLMSSPPPMQDTMVGGGGGSKLDVSDPMAEADFHMAYGLYDQAADVLRKALRQSPERQDIQVKLLEVFFTAGDRDNFVVEAKKLRQSMGATPSKDWESVAIMGRQVAPNEALFTSSGAPSGATVDIALGTGGTDTVVSDLGDAFSASPPPAPAPKPAPAAPADNLMEFSLPDIEPAPATEIVHAPAEAPKAGGMEFDLGDLNFEPTPAKAKEVKAAPTLGTDEPTVATDFGTDSQVEFDKALNDLAAFVNTNVPAQPEAPEPSIGSLSMDDAPAPAMAAGGDEPAASSISEIGTKLDLARAYIDMGDPDGAKSILTEVIGEGNAQQKQEAQELLKHVS
ncbi:MAG TPA: FimV/HubP family polar landmark protein [Gammaproteobacteria bacterium]|jgi:pilus assembly protein FimV|nr:FimV/HubP family polar landmark protein [Gammaproteobacteria bacterium]